jgi:predicted transcriptional regulator
MPMLGVVFMKEKVSNYLKSVNVGKSPTEIGLALGKCYVQASSSVNGALKSLLKDGLISKSKIDKKVLYKWVR